MEVRRINIISEVCNILEKRIIGKKYKPGKCLPSQSNLAHELGVSRNSIREAINRLTTMGLVKPVQGVGTIVLANQSHPMLQQVFAQFNISNKDASTVIETRMIVERAIVRLAALRARKRDIANLEKNLSEQHKFLSIKDREKFAESDIGFHLLLGKASRNKLLLAIEESNLIPFRELVFGVINLPVKMELAFERHRKIMEGIRQKDPVLADREMTKHILNTISYLPQSTAVSQAKKALLY